MGHAKSRTFLSTNVGVRLNARHYQPLPEFDCHAAEPDVDAWCEAVFATFKRFLDTPDGAPRLLTVRLRLSYEAQAPTKGNGAQLSHHPFAILSEA